VATIKASLAFDCPQLDKCFGYETCVEEAQKALLAAKVEASSAYRGVGLVKLMGRWAGQRRQSARSEKAACLPLLAAKLGTAGFAPPCSLNSEHPLSPFHPTHPTPTHPHACTGTQGSLQSRQGHCIFPVTYQPCICICPDWPGRELCRLGCNAFHLRRAGCAGQWAGGCGADP
jgi:hypothetical protein